METTLVILKPDAVERGLLGEIITRLEKKGLKIAGMKMDQLSESIIEEHYAHLLDKPFFPKIKSYMTRTPVVILAVKGDNAVANLRNMIGATNPFEAATGTVRGDLALTVDANLIHASDSPESAQIELQRFFGGQGVYDYKRLIDEVL